MNLGRADLMTARRMGQSRKTVTGSLKAAASIREACTAVNGP